MLLGLLVVVDAHEEDVASVFRYLSWVFLALYLLYGSVNCVVEFELYNNDRLIDISARNHHKVGKAFASGIFTMYDILILCPDIGNGEHAGKGVLIVACSLPAMVALRRALEFCIVFTSGSHDVAFMALFISSATSLFGI